MKIEEFRKRRRKPRNEEHNLQSLCVAWFHAAYPSVVIFAIPNGSKRDAVTGAILKAEGVLAGVADLFISKSNRFYHGFYIEMKTPKGTQQESQKEFMNKVRNDGYKYELVRTYEDFVEQVKNYLE